MHELININAEAFLGLGAITLLAFVGTLLLLPVLVARIPADYFVRERSEREPRHKRPLGHALVRRVVKNVIGLAFVMAGFIMLFTPGQGLLFMLVGVTLMDFPGKVALARRIIEQPGVLRAANWMRRKAKQPPLQVPPREEQKGRGDGAGGH